MDKNREQTEQAQIMKEKEIKRTLRKARVRKNASPEQAKARLISYVGKAKLGK